MGISVKNFTNKLRIRPIWAREGLAELLGTFILVMAGDAAIAQTILSYETKGSALTIYWGWGVGIMLAILVSGGISGGHLNPAVSLGLATVGKFQWKKLPVYMFAQYLGAFLGSAIVFGVYKNAFDAFDDGVRAVNGTTATAGILATYPAEFLTTGNGIADQVVGTGLLLILINAICDERNMQIPKYLVPLFVGFTVFNIGVSFGFNCGYAINPARDLGPRIFTAIAGWGISPFSYRDYTWWWVPVVGPYLGGIIGCWLYMMFVEFHHPPKEGEQKSSSNETDSLGLAERAKYGSMDKTKKEITQ